MMRKLFERAEDLKDYLFRIVDNGGSRADRYMVVFSDGSYLALSSYPSHPHGVSMFGDDISPATLQEWIDNGSAVDLALGDLPEGLVGHILYRNNQGFADFLASVEEKKGSVVAQGRDAADLNEGVYSCAGKGIYWTGEGYRIRLDGPEEDDRGPYATARDVVLASLPDNSSLSGPEYHSPVDVMRLTPDAEVLASVVALEARRDVEWRAEQEKAEAERVARSRAPTA